MAKEESSGGAVRETGGGGGGGAPAGSVTAAAVAAVEKHFAMHGIYGLPPPSTGAMPPSPQQQRQMKHSSARDEPTPDEQDFLSSASEYLILFVHAFVLGELIFHSCFVVYLKELL